MDMKGILLEEEGRWIPEEQREGREKKACYTIPICLRVVCIILASQALHLTKLMVEMVSLLSCSQPRLSCSDPPLS